MTDYLHDSGDDCYQLWSESEDDNNDNSSKALCVQFC
jgi:hypothetical protein